MTGGGNQVGGASISARTRKSEPQPGDQVIEVTERVSVLSKMKQLQDYAHGMGRSITVELPWASARAVAAS